jgi:hypothetical protein
MRCRKGIRLKLVSEPDASPEVRATFEEVRHALGVPTVPVLYQAYAAVPRFLELHWQVFRPALQSRKVFHMGERLAAEVYTRAQSYFDIPGLKAEHSVGGEAADGDGCPLAKALEYYQYLDPLLLIITVAQMQAFDGTVGYEQGDGVDHADLHPVFVAAPDLATLDGTTAALQRIWEERRRALELTFVPEEHRAAAMWPSTYLHCWTALKNHVASPLYADCQYRIGESAWNLVRDLPVQVETEIPRLLEAGVTDEEVCSLARINETLIAAFTGLLLDVTFLRIACEGGSRPRRRPEKTVDVLQAESAGTRAA